MPQDRPLAQHLRPPEASSPVLLMYVRMLRNIEDVSVGTTQDVAARLARRHPDTTAGNASAAIFRRNHRESLPPPGESVT